MAEGVQLIKAPQCLDGTEGLLAIIIRWHYPPGYGIQFFTQDKDGLQLGSIRRPEGWEIPAHTHTGVHPQTQGTQEVLVIRGGRVRITIYTSSGNWVGDYMLATGDIIMLVSGGHSLKFLEETDMVEIKQGPYPGPSDKVLL